MIRFGDGKILPILRELKGVDFSLYMYLLATYTEGWQKYNIKKLAQEINIFPDDHKFGEKNKKNLKLFAKIIERNLESLVKKGYIEMKKSGNYLKIKVFDKGGLKI